MEWDGAVTRPVTSAFVLERKTKNDGDVDACADRPCRSVLVRPFCDYQVYQVFPYWFVRCEYVGRAL